MDCVAVYIDCENICYKDFEYINKEIRNYGRMIVCNLYADWRSDDMKNWCKVASTYGLNSIQCDKIKGKNSVDIKIAVDLTCFSYERDHVQNYFIVTTDSDFRHVIFPLREKNKMVYCIGYAKVNAALTGICDKYIKIENLRKKVNKTELEEYWSIIRDCVLEKGINNIGKIKQFLLLQFPTFDEKDYNEKRFSQFLLNKYPRKLEINTDYVKLINPKK